MSRRIVRWLPAVAWMGFIFMLSSAPGSRIPGRFSTVGHFVTYAVLGGLLALALDSSRPSGHTVAIAMIVASLYAVTDEYHQSFVPLRTPDVADWGVDTLGAFAGAAPVATATRRIALRRGASDKTRDQ